MQSYLHRLIQEVDYGEDYWRAANLVKPYIEQTILPLLQGALDHILPAIKRRHEVHPDRPDKRVASVHYTTIGVLMQMLQCQRRATPGTLRLYDSMHLNDPDEGNYLPQIISAELQFAWLADRREHLHQDEIDGPANEIAYMASFVAGDAASDNLVFWRTYGREGKGCSMVCSITATYLQQILYGDNVKQTIELLRPVLASLTPIVTANDESIHDMLRDTVWSSLRSILYLYKSKAYDYENERRYVLPSSKVVPADIYYEHQDTPCGMPKIRHYLERPDLSINDLLPSGSIITIGPCVPQPTHVRRLLSTIARRALKGQPEIRLSEIFYRQI